MLSRKITKRIFNPLFSLVSCLWNIFVLTDMFFIHISFTNKLIFLHWNKGYFQLPFQNENIWYGFLSCKQFMSIWAKSFYVCSSTSKQYCIILAILSFCKVNVKKIESRKSFYFISFTKFILFSTSVLLHWSMHIFCKNLAWPWNFCKQQRAYNCTYLLSYSVCYSMLNAVTIVAVISSYSNVYIWHVGFTSQILFTFQIFWPIHIFR